MKKSKILSIFLSVLLFFQSCGASYKGGYTLQDALNYKRKVRIETTYGEKLEYQKVDTLKGQWVGEKLVNNHSVFEPINSNTIRDVQIHRSKQTESNEGLIILGVIAGVILIIVGISSAVKNVKVFGGN